jgi:plasmid stabilization system protein ParE
MEIIWTKPSKNDLQNFLENIHEGTEKSANLYILDLIDYSEVLKDNPNVGKMLSEYNDYNIRQLIYRKHKILYNIRGNTVYILSVIHSSRNMKSILKELTVF